MKQIKSESALILSQTIMESTTDTVTKWLNFFDTNYLRLNGEDLLKINELSDLPKNEFIKCIWFRRKISQYDSQFELKKKNFEAKTIIDDFLISEFRVLHSFLFFKYDVSKWINNPVNDRMLNKLDILYKAHNFGIKIPFSEVITKKEKLNCLLDERSSYIVKPISECIFINHLGKEYKMLTKEVTKKTLKYLPETFYPSIVQEKIEKKFEIRSFYLYGNFYSMAIFSQQNDRTKLDFRDYDDEKPNRVVPYKLPINIEKKLKSLMKFYKFNTGSIDLLYDNQGNYFFLEINPEGQFGMVSYPCNYFLEKKMALKIKKNVEKK